MSEPWRLASYSLGDAAPRAGIVVGERIFDAPGASVLQVLESWDEMQRFQPKSAGHSLSQVRLFAPLLYPGTIYCAGANYTDHVIEMAKAANRPPPADPRGQGLKPWFFIKPARSTVVGPGARVARPRGCAKLDWEAELVAVIGRRARDVSVSDALDCVAGYTIANDLSARDLSRRPPLDPASPFYYDWSAHKGFEGSCPMGPWITPAALVPDPQRLEIRLWVNGVLKQDSSTAQMIYSVAEQISRLSELATLHPGDVILTGTPAGVGTPRGEFLQPGDRVAIEIEALGRLETSIS
jgi:2-keto-4-pentenoate hydratase/2-oxohepta-3-ene-1,7-dioic acid hydratase in catechol pathway